VTRASCLSCQHALAPGLATRCRRWRRVVAAVVGKGQAAGVPWTNEWCRLRQPWPWPCMSCVG
jgi:hypothetical protein